MPELKCPHCHAEMYKVVAPDISTDVCPECKGVWLEKGEINVLASGMAGDIEHCSIDDKILADRFSVRKCPKCKAQDLKKMNLLYYSEIIFDYCPECNGFFLDEGEIHDMNVYLAGLAEDELPEEYRCYINGYLVTAKKVDGVHAGSPFGPMGIALSVGGHAYLRISVYFPTALELGLRVYQSKLNHRVLKRLKLFRKQDILTGNEKLDDAFIIQGDEEGKIGELFSRKPVSDYMLEFAEQKPRVFQNPGALEIMDSRLMYTEGPYIGSVRYDVEEDPSGIVHELVNFAELIENNR